MSRVVLLFGAFLICVGCGTEQEVNDPEPMDEYRRRTPPPSRSVNIPNEPEAPEMAAQEPEAPFIETGTTNQPEEAGEPEMAVEEAPTEPGDVPNEMAEEAADPDEETEPVEMMTDDDYIFDPADDNVRAQFEFNGNVQDASEAELDGLLIGGEFVGTDFGQGLRVSDGDHGFDWSEHSVFLRHPYTIEMVFTPESDSATFSKLFSPNDDVDDGWYLYRAGFRTYPINGVTAGSDMMPFNQQTYLAIVSTSETEVEVYINGQRVTDEPISSQISANPQNAIFFRDDAEVGRYETLHAVIDGMRISSAARTIGDIQAIQAQLQTR